GHVGFPEGAAGPALPRGGVRARHREARARRARSACARRRKGSTTLRRPARPTANSARRAGSPIPAKSAPPGRRPPMARRLLREGGVMANKRVLVVDDQAPIRELVAAVLSADGHTVETARDGADALRLLDGRPGFDLIVSDLKMPGLDGPSLYLELTRRWPDTQPHLLFISGFVDSPEYAGFLQGTRAQVLLKPFAVDDLSRAVSAILAGA